jgi:hypothetical protein
MVGAVTGMASLNHYVWLDGSLTSFSGHNGDRRPGVFDYSFMI